MSTAIATATYRCISPMIQLTAPRDGNSNLTAGYETICRSGDILPTWVTSGDVARLLVDGFIETVVGA